MGESLGARLKQLRMARSWSQKDLAQAAGAEQTAISRIEVRKDYEPGAFLLYQIALALNTTVDALLEGVVEFKPAPVAQDSDLVVRLASEQAQLSKRVGNLETSVSEGFESVTKAIASLGKSKVGSKR